MSKGDEWYQELQQRAQAAYDPGIIPLVLKVPDPDKGWNLLTAAPGWCAPAESGILFVPETYDITTMGDTEQVLWTHSPITTGAMPGKVSSTYNYGAFTGWERQKSWLESQRWLRLIGGLDIREDSISDLIEQISTAKGSSRERDRIQAETDDLWLTRQLELLQEARKITESDKPEIPENKPWDLQPSIWKDSVFWWSLIPPLLALIVLTIIIYFTSS